MFIFNTELLLIGVESPLQLAMIVVSAVIAMLVFATATQGYWLTKTRWYETAALLLIAFTLFRPGFFWDRIFPAYETFKGTEIVQGIETLPEDSEARIWVSGENLDGKIISKLAILPAGSLNEGTERLREMGLEVIENENRLIVDMVGFDSPAEKAGIDFDWQLDKLEAPADRLPREIIWIPALLLLGVIFLGQRKRRNQQVS